jgi:hypothetical protein
MAKTVQPKNKRPEGSIPLPIFCFELDDLGKLEEECRSRNLYSLQFAIRDIRERILTKRNLYKWKD